MALEKIKNLPSWISMELKISIPWVTNYGLGTASPNCTSNEFVTIKSPFLT